MEVPSPRYIITRAIFLIALIVAALYGSSFIKKKQRQSAIIAEIKSITSDSAFFNQFYSADAEKTLVKAIALMAEANNSGIPPNELIDKGLGTQHEYFNAYEQKKEPPVREKIIRATLLGNYENFRKLGYNADFHTLRDMKQGDLPVIPAGPESGKKPEIGTIIDPAISPGIERVLANLELRPPRPLKAKPTDVEIAAARQLARDLAEALVIEESARDRMLEKLATPDAPAQTGNN
jgi:hypothetical protein